MILTGRDVEALNNKNNSLQIFVETTSEDSTATVKAGNNYPNVILGDSMFLLKVQISQLFFLKIFQDLKIVITQLN